MSNIFEENKYLKMLELDKILDDVKKELDLKISLYRLNNMDLMVDLEDIRISLAEVNEASILYTRMHKFPIYFSDDISLSFTKIHKMGLITALELAQIGNFLDTIRDLVLYFNHLDDNNIPYDNLKHHLDNIVYLKDLNLRIRTIVTPYGEIKEDASLTLKQIYKSISDIEHNIQSKIQELLSKNASKLTSLNVSFRNDRFVLPVKNEYKNQIKGIIHDESSSGETVFIEPMQIVEMNNKITSLKEEALREIDRIIKNISLEIDSYYDVLLLDYEELINLDIIFAKAKYAIKIDARMPQVNNDGIVELYNCFHPLLNVSHIVKNNIIIGKEYKGIIITGPNTGGKTVLLKTLGLLSLMVKCGLMIPASDNSNINVFDNVFCDIGDEQSINQNLSTFSSHMVNVIDIINNVTENSLVLLDELGSGTDPVEGSSLAIAVFDYFIKKKCLLVSTSHYSELKLHAFENENIINASVEFDVNTLKPTYKLLIGVPGMSNAINVCTSLGLKQEILDEAINYVYKKNDNISLVLDKMVKQSNLLDKKIKEVEEEKSALNQKILEKEEEIKKILNDKNKIINDANKEKEKIIQNSMDEINNLIDELKNLKNSNIKGHEIADIKHRINQLNKDNLEEQYYEEDLKLELGSRVYIKSYKAYGIVNKILKDKCEVNLGSISMKIDMDDLVVTKDINVIDDAKNNIKKNTDTKIEIKKSIPYKLDLRGMRYDEAKDKIEKYLDDCIYFNMPSCTIIHGYGTGTMRKLVQDLIKNNKNIESSRYGGENEGGSGATIVIFKKKEGK
ncbi:MAG: endonuclease MutS2 [Bacilli bacterium]|nr:endonuclease MutS2 [Bacilli bacterium]